MSAAAASEGVTTTTEAKKKIRTKTGDVFRKRMRFVDLLKRTKMRNTDNFIDFWGSRSPVRRHCAGRDGWCAPMRFGVKICFLVKNRQ